MNRCEEHKLNIDARDCPLCFAAKMRELQAELRAIRAQLASGSVVLTSYAARALGRLGGKSKSKAKARASRINGKKGGRPRKRLG